MSPDCCTWSAARAAARTRWPGVAVAIPDDVDASPPAYAVDLLLANACARGDRAAVRTLLREFGAAIDAVLARRGVARWDRADLHQTLLERLLVDRPGQSARIRSYRGDGPLRGWLRVCIARELLMLQRRRVARVEPIDASAPASTRDPEQHAVVVERERSFVRALGAGLDDLDPRERNVLRLSLLHGLYHEQIAAMYGVHRVTVARWLGGVRDKLRRATCERGRFDGAGASDPPAGVDLHVSQLLGRACEHEA
jgi:RNA polymerase sigma-70 factor (ECF subfamily)